MIVNIFGWAATICMLCGYLPQAIYTLRTRDTDGIALPTFLAMGLGALFFALQGILTDNIPLVLTNIITATCSAIITVIKIRNDRRKRK